MTPHSIKYAAIPLLLGIIFLPACPPRVVPRNPATQLIAWMFGDKDRANPSSPDVILGSVPQDKLKPSPTPKPPPKPPNRLDTGTNDGNNLSNAVEKRSRCFQASSFVPTPKDDGRLFFAVNGKLHVMGKGDTAPKPFGSLAQEMQIVELLATRNVSEGLELLASVQVEGKTEVHALVVNESGIVRSGVVDIRVERIEDLFDTYTIPRCAKKNIECLEISRDNHGMTFLESRLRATGPPAKPNTLGNIPGLVDATWSPENDGSVYVLQRCDANGDQGP